jgi:hypothetical protein
MEDRKENGWQTRRTECLLTEFNLIAWLTQDSKKLESTCLSMDQKKTGLMPVQYRGLWSDSGNYKITTDVWITTTTFIVKCEDQHSHPVFIP